VSKRLQTISVWVVRLSWIAAALLPNTFGVLHESASDTLTTTLAAQSWVMWSLVAIATWILHPVSLTVIRIFAPLLVIRLTVGVPASDYSPLGVAATVAAAAAMLLAFSAEYGHRHVQAAAYGAEVRHLLRIPTPLVAPTVIGWLVIAGTFGAAPALLASGNWMIGAPLAILAALALWRLVPRLHRLARRWFVHVPAGWVIHDDVILQENLLIKKHAIVAVDRALADSQALDLTGFTRGVPLEVMLRDMVDVRLTPLAARLNKTDDALHAKAFLVAPSRPLDVLHSQLPA
jgi:hypothetical protein